MENFREIEAIRRPGSPQLEVTKVRGSWRDYLDPIDYSDIDEIDSESIEYDRYDYDDEDFVLDGCDFEPFSDTCGECENEGDETDTDMEGLDLTLFEPVKSSTLACRLCFCPSFRREHIRGESGYLMISLEEKKCGKLLAPT